MANGHETPAYDAETERLIGFRLEANRNTYAAKKNAVASTRYDSHDFAYSRGAYAYHDTYVGGERFAGEEAVFLEGRARYAMNYAGRVLDPAFSGDFLKEALLRADMDMPYRGPALYEADGHAYECRVDGGVGWFQGYEQIRFEGRKVYECFFHGGLLQ